MRFIIYYITDVCLWFNAKQPRLSQNMNWSLLREFVMIWDYHKMHLVSNCRWLRAIVHIYKTAALFMSYKRWQGNLVGSQGTWTSFCTQHYNANCLRDHSFDIRMGGGKWQKLYMAFINNFKRYSSSVVQKKIKSLFWSLIKKIHCPLNKNSSPIPCISNSQPVMFYDWV